MYLWLLAVQEQTQSIAFLFTVMTWLTQAPPDTPPSQYSQSSSARIGFVCGGGHWPCERKNTFFEFASRACTNEGCAAMFEPGCAIALMYACTIFFNISMKFVNCRAQTRKAFFPCFRRKSPNNWRFVSIFFTRSRYNLIIRVYQIWKGCDW